jgi:hypothetical protein
MNLVYLRTLPPGSRFRTQSGREGTLIKSNDCRARVRYGSSSTKTITKTRPGLTDDGEPEHVSFDVTVPAAEVDIAPNTQVVQIS